MRRAGPFSRISTSLGLASVLVRCHCVGTVHLAGLVGTVGFCDPTPPFALHKAKMSVSGLSRALWVRQRVSAHLPSPHLVHLLLELGKPLPGCFVHLTLLLTTLHTKARGMPRFARSSGGHRAESSASSAPIAWC